MPRKYGQKASEKVERAMHEMKRGELKSGGSGKTVHDRKQALASGRRESPADRSVPLVEILPLFEILGRLFLSDAS